jgi:hypothetical protein
MFREPAGEVQERARKLPKKILGKPWKKDYSKPRGLFQ